MMNRPQQIILMALMAFLIMPALASAQKSPADETVFDPEPDLSGCVLPHFKTPPEAKIYAVGARGGSKLSWQIDDSGREGTLIKVAVNAPLEYVVLVLEAFEPTIWHLGWTKDSQIAAVLLSGHNTQKIIGLPENVPVLINTAENGSPCGKLKLENSKTITPEAEAVSKHLFGRGIDDRYGVVSGQAVVGELLPAEAKLITKAQLRREDFQLPDTPLFGEAGLKEALDKGLIRTATSDDIQKYFKLRARVDGLPEQIIPDRISDDKGLTGAYVVLSSAFMSPLGLPRNPKYLVLSESAEPLKKTGSGVYFGVGPAAPPQKDPPPFKCGFSDLNLPPGFQIYAASIPDSGVPLDLDFGNRSKEPRLIKVTVNSPEKPAVLMLGTYLPTIWHFSWTKGSKIAAVAVSGGSPPIMMGLPEDVPVLTIGSENTRDNEQYRKCPQIDVRPTISSLTAANDLSKHLFNKDIDQISEIKNGELIIGRPLNDRAGLETTEEFSVDKFKDPDKPLTYRLAFDEAKRKSLIRPSSPEDIKAYLEALARSTGLPDKVIDEGLSLSEEAPADHSLFADVSLPYSYTILSPEYVIPENLYPPNVIISFILPKGIKKPERTPDNVILYDANEPRFPEKKQSPYASPPKPCNLPVVKLPPNTKIYAGSGFLSSPVDFDFTGEAGERQRAELVPLMVNSPKAPVALILQSHYFYPTIWHFSWTKGTKIAAVVASGRILGLPADVPVINPKDCDGFRFPVAISNIGDVEALKGINDFSKKLFQKDVDRLYYAESNVTLIGQPLGADEKTITGRELKLDELIDPDKPWGNRTYASEDILKGLIRKATTQDIRERLRNRARDGGLPEPIIKKLKLYDRTRPTPYLYSRNEENPIPNAYMVLSPDYIIPASLYHSEFVPIRGTTHGDKASESGMFYYPDGSFIRCSFVPNESKDSPEEAQEFAKAASRANKDSGQSGLPPNFKLRYKSSPQDEDYQILRPGSISQPGSNFSESLSASFISPDGGRTHCNYYKGETSFVGGAKQQEISKTCSFPDFKAPPRLKVYAAEAGSGTKLNITLGERGHTAELVQVTINSPKEPVALLLSASEPTIWHFSWTEGSKIAAVLVSGGLHPQYLDGLPKDVPTIHTGGECPNFEVSLSGIHSPLKVNNLARHLFNKDVDDIYEIYGGQILIGDKPLGDKKVKTAEEFDIARFADPDLPLVGIQGLKQALDKGLIRKATDEDYKKWLVRHYTNMQNIPEEKVEEAIAEDRRADKYDQPPRSFRNAYVVLSPDFIVPAGLKSYGGDSADFIIPEDIPLPSRRLSYDSTYYLLKDGSCEGKGARPVCKAKH